MSRRAFNSMGLGDVLNPTAGTALDCGFFAGGVFKRACWCLSFPSLCSTETYQAASALANPNVYAPIQAPPAVPAVPAGYTSQPVSVSEAASEIDQALAEQMAAWQGQNVETMSETQANLDALAAGKPSLFGSDGGMNWALWLGIAAAAVFAVVSLGGGSPRRYAR